MRWSHVGLTCGDPRRTAEFYARWFGFAIARVVPFAGNEIIFIRRGEVYLELFPLSSAEPHRAEGDGPNVRGLVRHIAFQVDDVDAFLATVGDAAEVTLGPLDFDEFIPGWRTAWLRDPDGVIVEVSQGYRDDEAVTVSARHGSGGGPHG